MIKVRNVMLFYEETVVLFEYLECCAISQIKFL